MSWKTVSTALLLVLHGGGCTLMYDDEGGIPPAPVRETPPRAPPPAPLDPAPRLIDMHEAYLEGDLGEVQGFAGGVYAQQITAESYWADVRIDALGPAGWAMVGFDLQYGVDGPFALPPGTVLHPTSSIGCSGPAPASFTYDAQPGAIEVVSSTGSAPGSVRFDFAMEFIHDGEGQIVTGSFELSAP